MQVLPAAVGCLAPVNSAYIPCLSLDMAAAIHDFEWCWGPHPSSDGVSLIPQPWQDVDDIGLLFELTQNPLEEVLLFEGRRWQLASLDRYGLRLYTDMDGPGTMLIREKSTSEVVVQIRASPVPERNTVRLVICLTVHFQIHQCFFGSVVLGLNYMQENICICRNVIGNCSTVYLSTQAHTHTHIYIYIYKYVHVRMVGHKVAQTPNNVHIYRRRCIQKYIQIIYVCICMHMLVYTCMR